MGKAQKMANTPSKTASTLKSRDALMLEFKRKFEHAYDPMGYYGHPLFGYCCYGCGIHIIRIAGKNLGEQLELGVADTRKSRSPRTTLPESFQVPAGR